MFLARFSAARVKSSYEKDRQHIYTQKHGGYTNFIAGRRY